MLLLIVLICAAIGWLNGSALIGTAVGVALALLSGWAATNPRNRR